MPETPAPNTGQPPLAGPIVNPTRQTLPVRQSKSTSLLEALDPFVSCFSADGPAPRKLEEWGFVTQKFLNEFPPLFFLTSYFPRHIALEVSPMR
jgi:hypothetical protein